MVLHQDLGIVLGVLEKASIFLEEMMDLVQLVIFLDYPSQETANGKNFQLKEVLPLVFSTLQL